MINGDQKFLQKVAEFTNMALGEIEAYQEELQQFRTKEAAEKRAKVQKEAQLDSALKKAAQALYESDFITDDAERNRFLKLAKSDPVYLAETLAKVCQAADVSTIGAPAKTTLRNKSAENDPVYDRAFGHSAESVSFDDE